jgi:hypothetical protein
LAFLRLTRIEHSIMLAIAAIAAEIIALGKVPSYPLNSGLLHKNKELSFIIAMFIAAVVLILTYYIAKPMPSVYSASYNGICNSNNTLYGLPQESMYIAYNGSNDSFSGNGVLSSVSCYYSLGIMYPVFSGSNEAKVTQSLPVPKAYLGYTYPTGINVNIIELANSSYANIYAKRFYGSVNKTVYYTKNGTIAKNGTIMIRFTSSPVDMYGINVSEIKFYPIYDNYTEYQLAFKEGKYFVIINTYGINGTYSQFYAKELLLRYHSLICGLMSNGSISCL